MVEIFVKNKLYHKSFLLYILEKLYGIFQNP